MEALLFKSTLKRNQVCSYYHPTFFEFEGVNTGNEEVRVIKHSSSCSCTKAAYPKSVKPGETFIVTMIVDKTHQKGNFNQSVTLNYSNGQEIKLKVNGTIEQPADESE